MGSADQERGSRGDLVPEGESLDYGHRLPDDLRAFAQSWLNDERRADEKCVGEKLIDKLEDLTGRIAGQWIGRMPRGLIEIRDLKQDGYLAALEWLRKCEGALPERDVLEAGITGAITQGIKRTHEKFARAGHRVRGANSLTPTERYEQIEEERVGLPGDAYRNTGGCLKRAELLEGVLREVRSADRDMVRAMASGCTNAELGEMLVLDGDSPDEAARKRRKAMQAQLTPWLVEWGYVLDAGQETFSVPASQPTLKREAGDYPKPLETAAAAVPCEGALPKGRGTVGK